MQALAAAIREILWLRKLLEELGVPQEATVVYEDNAAVLALSSKPSVGSKTKYLVVRELWVRQAVDDGHIRVEYVKSADQRADILTKWLPAPAHKRHCDALLC
jgi:hypothetical protein